MIDKKIVFSLYDLNGGRSASKANSLLEKSQYWSREQIEQHQLKKLKEILIHAKDKIPYYQKIISTYPKESWDYQDMLLFMQDIPILKKVDVQNHFDELLDPNSNVKELFLQNTGGTSGRPTKFYHDSEKLDYTRVALQRNFDWAGYYMRKKCIKLASGQYETTINKGLKGRIKNILYNRYFHEGSLVENEKWPRDVLEIINKKKIKIIWGYPSIIHALARNLGDAKELGIESIITSSETLQENQRQMIEEVFNCKIFDAYGSREFMIASECEAHKGLHINEEIILLEILDDKGVKVDRGKEGNIIITDLYNKSFPFIRFEMGDTGVFYEKEEACSCGKTLKRLKQLNGRSSEAIKINDTIISQLLFSSYLKTIENIEAYQVLVFDKSMQINIMVHQGSGAIEQQKIKTHLDQRFNGKIPLEIKTVKKLMQEPNGKVLVIKKMDKPLEQN